MNEQSRSLRILNQGRPIVIYDTAENTLHTFDVIGMPGYYHILKNDHGKFVPAYRDIDNDMEENTDYSVYDNEIDALDALLNIIRYEIATSEWRNALIRQVKTALRTAQWTADGVVPVLPTVVYNNHHAYMIFKTRENGFGWVYMSDSEDDESATGYESVDDAIRGAMEDVEENIVTEESREGIKKALSKYLC